MGSVIAISSVKSKDISLRLSNMHKILDHRGHSYGIATPQEIIIRDDNEGLNDIGSLAICHNYKKIMHEDVPHPIRIGGGSLVFEGRFFSLDEGEGIQNWVSDITLKDFPLIFFQVILLNQHHKSL